MKIASYSKNLITIVLALSVTTVNAQFGDILNSVKNAVGTVVNAGVQVIVLLALNDDGAPSFDHEHAAFFSSLAIPVFACTPDKFPELMAAALSKQDVHLWAAREDLVVKK